MNQLFNSACNEACFCSADENVKKIFAMEMNRDIPKLHRYTQDMIDKVRRHPFDESTHEVFSKLVAMFCVG